MDKETLEKQRLKTRTGGYHKYDEFQKIVGHERGTPGYQNEAQRFDTDTAAEEHHLKQAKLERQKRIYDKRREENLKRDELRYERERERQAKEFERWKKLRDNPKFGLKNNGSTPYNQITLQYNEGRKGQELKYQDSMIKWRAAHRARRLQEKMMGDNINPITGQPQSLMDVPERPSMPF